MLQAWQFIVFNYWAETVRLRDVIITQSHSKRQKSVELDTELAVWCVKQAPIIPLLLHNGDTSNFDIYQEVDLQLLQPSPDEDVALFHDFWP